jgi:hypothetical protein
MDEFRPAVIQRAGRRRGRLRSFVTKATVLLAVALIGSVALASRGSWRTAPSPLLNTFHSPHAVAEAVLSSVQTGNLESLEALTLAEPEFRRYVWPELPVSRREANTPFEFVWGTLHRNSEAHLQQTLARFRGQRLALKRVEFQGASTRYRNVTVHRDTRLVVDTADGTERVVRLFGSMIEQDGRWKVFSYVVD